MVLGAVVVGSFAKECVVGSCFEKVERYCLLNHLKVRNLGWFESIQIVFFGTLMWQ